MNKRTTKHSLVYPEQFTDRYDETDKRNVRRIIDWLNSTPVDANEERSQIKLGMASDVKQTTINMLLKGQYPSPAKKHLNKIIVYLDREEERSDEKIDAIVKTSVYKIAIKICKMAHKRKDFGILSAKVGTGKTTALKHYTSITPNVFLVEGDPDMNASVMIDDLIEKTGATFHASNNYTRGTKAERYAGLVRKLIELDALIILDEADKVRAQTLEYIRRISDKAQVGVVLAGTEKLKPMVRDSHGRFGQISSRVGFWPSLIKAITKNDAKLMVEAAINENLTKEVLDAFWQVCDGSARTLSKLIPNVIDFGLKKEYELSAELVFEVGQQAMGLTPVVRKEIK